MAVTSTLAFQGTLGPRTLKVWSVAGDGTTKTVDSGLFMLDHVWAQNQDDPRSGNSITISSTNFVTFHAIANTKKMWVFCLGAGA